MPVRQEVDVSMFDLVMDAATAVIELLFSSRKKGR